MAVLIVVLLVGAAPALAAVADYAAPIQDDVPVTTDQTPTIVLGAPDGADVNLVDMWEGDQLNITTSAGNITVSGDSGASAHLAVSDIEGTQTQVTQIDAGANWIELDPYDKQRVDVRGDADTLAFSQIAVDDGSTDLQVGGPSGGVAELRLHGLAGTTQYALYDASRDEVLGTLTTDSTGTGAGTVDMPDGTQALQVRTVDDFADPTVSNVTPTGQVTERPTEISADVTAEAYPTTVVFEVNGATADTVNISASGTVTGDVSDEVTDLGTYDYSVTVTDDLGQTDSLSASFQTPSKLTLREETDPQNLVNNSNMTLRFFTVDGEIAIERQPTNATLDLRGLPDTEFVVFVESPNHYDRTVYLNSIYEQQNIFLLNETVAPRDTNEALRSRFIYEDLTGDFPREQTTVQIQRALDVDGDNTSEYRTVAGDYWGASNEFEGIFEKGVRYRIVLVNQETGAEYIAGSHIPTEELSQTIRVSGLAVEAANASGVYANSQFSENDNIEVVYRDPADATDQLQVSVESRDGDDVLFNDTVAGPIGTYGTTVTLNETQAEQDWVVRFDAGDRHRSAAPVGSGQVAIPFAVPGWILTLLGSMTVTFVGALYGPRTALLGAWSMVFVAAGIAMFGWAFSGVSVLVAALVATGMTILAAARP